MKDAKRPASAASVFFITATKVNFLRAIFPLMLSGRLTDPLIILLKFIKNAGIFDAPVKGGER